MNLLLLLGTLAAASVARGTGAKAKTVAAKQAPATAKHAGPVSLGNGVYVLGDEGAQPLPPMRAPQKSSNALKSRASVNLNARLVQFCRSYLGRKLGNGQCSELAALGLPAIGARLDFSQQWGHPVCHFGTSGGRQWIQLGEAGRTAKNWSQMDVRPGDIIQYENVRFEKHWPGGYSFQSYPHHTSVIEQVSRDGRSYKVLEQNVNNTQFVLETTLYLPDLTEGVLHITRPMPN